MHSKNDNIEVIVNDEADEVKNEVFNSLKNRCQNNLKSMKVGDFVVDYVLLLYYQCYKIYPSRGGSYIDSPDWIKNKNAAINPINKKDKKQFQCAVTVALNHEETGSHSKRVTNIKPFINKHKWEGISFPSEKGNWKKFEKYNSCSYNFVC